MKKFTLIILLLLITSNYTKAYELKATVSEIENELKKFYRQNYETCPHFNRLGNLIISAEDDYKVILLIKHDEDSFDVKDIVLLDETNLHDDKFRGILENIVSWYNSCRAHSIQTSIPFFKSQNISEYILEYELKERSINIKLTEEDIRKISEGKNQVNSSDVSVKKFDIYNNPPYNWTLFGVKLYDKIENVNIIGKFKWHTYKTDKGYDEQCIFASTLNNKPLLIPSITDEKAITGEKGCINSSVFNGLRKFVNDDHYIVEPPNKNDFFSTYFVRYSPLTKRILSIAGKKKNETSSVDICVDEGNMIVDGLNDNLLAQYNNVIVNKYKFNDTTLNKTLQSIAVGYDPDTLYGLSEEQKIKNLGAVYGFDCVKGDFYNDNDFFFFLTTIYRDLKIYKEFDIMEENKLLDQKIRSEDNIKNVLKNDIL